MYYIYRILPSDSKEYAFFSAAHRTFSEMDHTLGYRATLGGFRECGITPCSVSDHKGTKPDIYSNGSYREYRKHAVSCRLSNTLLDDVGFIEELKKGILKNLES